MDLIFQLDKGAYKPLKAHQNDAGFDLFTPQEFVLKAKTTKIIDTGVHVAIPQGFVGLVLGRSSMSQKGVLTHIGVIDADYLGAIKIMLSSENEAVFYQGNKIAQLVILPLPQFNLIEGDVTKLKICGTVRQTLLYKGSLWDLNRIFVGLCVTIFYFAC